MWQAKVAEKGHDQHTILYSEKTQPPILLLLGLGMGPSQYLRLIGLLNRSSAQICARSLVIPLQPSTSLSLFHPGHLKPLNRLSITTGIVDILRQLKYEQVEV